MKYKLFTVALFCLFAPFSGLSQDLGNSQVLKPAIPANTKLLKLKCNPQEYIQTGNDSFGKEFVIKTVSQLNVHYYTIDFNKKKLKPCENCGFMNVKSLNYEIINVSDGESYTIIIPGEHITKFKWIIDLNKMISVSEFKYFQKMNREIETGTEVLKETCEIDKIKFND